MKIQWQGIAQVESHPCYSRETAAAVNAINDRIAALLDTRATIDQTLDRMRAADDGVDIFGHGSMLNAELYEAIKAERAIRTTLADVFAATNRDFTNAADESHSRVETESAKIKAKLVAIGFVDTGSTFNSQIAGSIAPGWIFNHPAVVRCRVERDELRTRGQRRDHIEANENAIAAVDRELARLKSRAIAFAT